MMKFIFSREETFSAGFAVQGRRKEVKSPLYKMVENVSSISSTLKLITGK